MHVRSLAVMATLLIPTCVRAHGLQADYALKSGTIHVEAYFDDDTPARNAHVVLQDEQQKPIAEGDTDAKGVCKLAAPPPGHYVLTVDAGMGHKVKRLVDIPGEGVTAKKDEAALRTLRKESTGFPLIKVLLGFGIILLAGVSFLIGRKITRLFV
jgi:hypothetical protein